MYLGIDIGGTKCAVTKSDKNGNIIAKKSVKTTTYEETIENIFKMCDSFLPFEVVGISCGGPLDEKKGIIMSPPNLKGWDNVEIVKMLEDRYKVKAFIENDANACALAEWKYGAGKGYQNVVFLTFGTGLGAGLILDGKLYRGSNGNAGEVGHIRLTDTGPIGFNKEGSFEGYCSGGGLKQIGQMLAMEEFSKGNKVSFIKDETEIDLITAKLLAEYARKGDKTALKAFDICAEMLGKGLSIIIDILNPEVIIIGSIYERCEDLLSEKMQKVLEKEALSNSLSIVKVKPSMLKDEIGDIAAISVAVNGVENDR